MSSLAPDQLARSVLLAVELIDPVTMAPVCRDVRLDAVGMAAGPLLSWSGRFVWLADGARWPSAFVFDPGSTPYASETYAAPPAPPDPAQLDANERLVRLMLRPTAAYPFGDGLSALRGVLREGPDATSAPVAGALVWIQWTDTGPSGKQDAPVAARTSASGDFATCLRLPRGARPERNGDRLKVRLIVARGAELRELALDLPDGRFLDSSAALDWSALSPSPI